jgi:hypothetical protein
MSSSLNKKIKDAFPAGMREGELLDIKLVCGFEMFGAYENWDTGYILTIPPREPSDAWYLPKDKLGRRELKVKSSNLDAGVDTILHWYKNLTQCSKCGWLHYSQYGNCCSVCYKDGKCESHSKGQG